MRRISHHARAREDDLVTGMGVSMPVILGRGMAEDVPEAVVTGTTTRSERHMPSPGTTVELLVQLAETQVPPRRT
jgi:hypothetical protein